MSTSEQTHNHDEIRKWAEKRGGIPARIKGTDKNDDEGILRIHFPENSSDDEKFEEIDWNDFFNMLDENKLDLLYQDTKKDGETSTGIEKELHRKKKRVSKTPFLLRYIIKAKNTTS